MSDDPQNPSDDALASLAEAGASRDDASQIPDIPVSDVVSDVPVRRTVPTRQQGSADLKRLAVPILVTVGVLLLIPGLWSIATLIGLNVPLSDQSDARLMAWIFLFSLPLSACLMMGAIVFYQQSRNDRN